MCLSYLLEGECEMRMTREELKEKWFTSWNDSRNDIIAVNYGDEPLFRYDQEKYEKFQKLTGTMANIEAIDAYIYTQNGNYDEYRTFAGTVKIAENGRVLCGDVNVKYRGKIHNIIINRMYGFYKLVILRMSSGKVVGFSNADGQGSPSIYTEEMDKDLIERILNDSMEDYGYGIQKFMECAREMYAQDSVNYIMEKRFGARK